MKNQEVFGKKNKRLMNTGELLLRMLTQKEQGGFLFDSEDHLAKHGQCQLIRGHTIASFEFNVIISIQLKKKKENQNG